MFTLPFDLLLIFTIISPVIGWIVPKQYRAKILGTFTAAALVLQASPSTVYTKT